MKLVKDLTGRLLLRPHYDRSELDHSFGDLCIDFLVAENGEAAFPVKTKDIERIIESKTSDLDSAVDLSNEGPNIEGMTVFYADRLPAVKISDKFVDERLRNRHRFTLAHELGHVVLHANLWNSPQPALFEFGQKERVIRCNRDDIRNPQVSDWLEWQAFYAGGAFLMPKRELARLAKDVQDLINYHGPIRVRSSAGVGLISKCAKHFAVSGAAARVRLLRLGFLTKEETAVMPVF